MNTIQANNHGTRFIDVSDANLATLKKYNLFNQLAASHGLIDEEVLNKLRLTIRSLIAHQEEDSNDLLDLCIDVIYHKDMKAFGLKQLIQLYNDKTIQPTSQDESTEELSHENG